MLKALAIVSMRSIVFVCGYSEYASINLRHFALRYRKDLASSVFTLPLQLILKSGSNRPEVFCKKGVLRNFTKFTGKHLCQRLFFNKVAGPGSGLQLY